MSNSYQLNKENLLELIKPYTVLSEERKNALYQCAESVNSNNIQGDFVECGVLNGGSAGILGGILLESNMNRKMWLFDSFEGLPEPSEADIDSHGEKGKKGLFTGSEEKVRELIFDKLKMSDKRVEIVKGWYEKTVPETEKRIDKIAVLHMDCDFYESVKICMNSLFDKIQSGGYLVIDDYGRWKGCKKAIDEFFMQRNIIPELSESDYTGRVYKKP